MTGSHLGLIGASVGAVAVPTRRIPTLALNDPAGLAAAVGLVVVLTALVIGAATVADRAVRPRRRPGPG